MRNLDFYTRKIAYLWLKFSEMTVNSIVYIYALLHKNKRNSTEVKKIAAYWYCPIDLTGSNIRLGGWTSFFHADGYVYDNFHINTLDEIVKGDQPINGWTKRYLMFAKCLWRRLPQMLKAHNYDVIWIDRSIIPEYPRKSAFLEFQLAKVVKKMVVDSTDGGDYLSNPSLMEGVFQAADELTVGYLYLKEKYSEKYKVTQVFWTISTDNYLNKTDYSLSRPIVIGWMGSPGNFTYVKEMADELKKLNELTPFEFHYICRQNMDEYLTGINVKHHRYDDNYYNILSSFDIGISPFLKTDLRTQGKIAMKHQEFLLMGIPQVCSPVAISEFVTDGKEVLIAKDKNEWCEKLTELIKNQELRESLGTRSRLLFDRYYHFSSQYEELKKVLTTLN